MNLFVKRKRIRIIDQCRALWGGTWIYEGMGSWTNGTTTVQAFSSSAPRYDGDDDSFVTEYRTLPGYVLVGGHDRILHKDDVHGIQL